MRSLPLYLLAFSALDVVANAASANHHARRIASRKFKNFAYPARASTHHLSKNQVDLGYEVHEGQVEKDKFLAFRNIPYAEPPKEELRWYEAIEPQSIRQEVNDGSTDHRCPQAQVGWVPLAQEFLMDFGNTSKFLPAKWKDEIEPKDYNQTMPAPIEKVDEDCLTLDVFVPNSVWEDKENAGAAVIVMIYGGGFIFGWKEQFGSPEGFFDAAAANAELDGNVIYVAMNYRLGAFGWLGGEKFKEDGGIPNIGLHDQAFSIKWVNRYIESFGGDPTRVTVMGQSAGGSSILHHITAGGGQSFQPDFQRAIIQSPGFFPQPNASHDDYIYSEYLRLTGAENLEALQKLDTSILQAANARMTYDSPYGVFNFGPTIDGDYVPDLPSKLLNTTEKSFHRGIAMMLGHTAYDGLLFTPPWIRTPEQLRKHAQKLYPSIPPDALTYIDAHYPIRQRQSFIPYLPILAQVKIANVSDFLDDIAIQCNNYYLTEAIISVWNEEPVPIWRYAFNTLPALHGFDVGYTFYPSPPGIPGVIDPTLARFSQKTIVNFARFGDPIPEDDGAWSMYTNDSRKVMNFGRPGQAEAEFSHGMGPDLLDGGKCKFWQPAPYWPKKDGEESEMKFVDQSRIYKELKN